ncbi:MAG: ribonuclease HII [Bacillota bacterium]|nr:ribonuclease HII [Bacillota bacterium]
MNNLEIENQLWNDGFNYIACIDEVGRGCLAGNVLACAVIMPKDVYIKDITDSKKLSVKKRNELSKIIKEKAVSFAFGIVEPEEIDEINIKNATLKAMKLAIEKLKNDSNKLLPDMLLIDAEKIPLDIPQKSVIKGDLLCHGISAASILAKVERDKIMTDLTENIPYLDNFDIKNNKGYGTKKHIEAIKKYGPTKHHRKTFLTKILDKNKQITLFEGY